MSTSGVLLTAASLSFLLFSSQNSFADSAKSEASAPAVGQAGQAVTRSDRKIDPDLLESLKAAKPMKPLKLEEDNLSGVQRSAPRLKPDGFGTVTKKMDGGISKRPVSPSVKKSLDKMQGLPKPIKGGNGKVQGAVEPHPSASSLSERAVFGADDRVRIRDTGGWPFRAFGLLLSTYADGSEMLCSGTLAGRHHVLTAAHCIYNVWTGEFPNAVTFFPAFNGNAAPYGAYDATAVSVLSGYTEPTATPHGSLDYQHMTHDMGVVELGENAGDTLGWFAYGYDDNLPPFTANIVGYPGDKPAYTMWRSSCDVDPWDGHPNLLVQQCDTFPGSSGSSLYDYESDSQSRTVYGVLSSENDEANVGVRITGPYFYWLQEQTEY